MEKEYTLLVFNNGTLVYAKSPTRCLFDTALPALSGKRIEEIFIRESIDQITKLEPNKKSTVNLCCKSTGSLFSARVSKTKFQKTETVLIYTNENLNHTNSNVLPLRKESMMETLLKEDNQMIYELIDEMKTTRNLAQIKRLKKAFSELYRKIDDCVAQIVQSDPKEKYHHESFNFSLAVKSYLEAYEAKYPDNIWISYHEFKSAFVLGSREKLIDLLDSFFQPFQTSTNTKMIARLMQENDTATAEFTVLSTDGKAEFSQELTDFAKDRKKLLAKHAGCEVKTYYLPNQGYKMTISYDSYSGYKLYEPDEYTERIALYEKDAQLLTTSD